MRTSEAIKIARELLDANFDECDTMSGVLSGEQIEAITQLIAFAERRLKR